MENFAIYSPVFGVRKDIPNIFLNKAYTSDSKNCQMWDGKVRTSYGRSQELLNSSGLSVVTPDGMPIIKYHEHVSDSASKYLLAFTRLHAYIWSPSAASFTDPSYASGLALHTCSTGTTITEWSVASYNGKVIATNNVDAPIIWSGKTEEKFVALNATVASGITVSKAKAVTVFESHVVFGNYSTSDSEVYPNGITWSDLDDETAWEAGTGSDAGSAYVDGEGLVCGFGQKNDLLYVFKNRSARIFWYTGTDLIFSSRSYQAKVGTFAADSIVNDDNGNLYFYGSDLTFREVDLGEISLPIKPVARFINQESSSIVNIKSTFIDEYKEIWWAIPTGSSDTNNMVVCYKAGVWYERDTAVSAFGKYSRSTNYSWDNQPGGTWDDWTGVWDDTQESAGWMFDICGDYYGYTYTSHSQKSDTYYDGSVFMTVAPTYYFVMNTDLKDNAGMRYYKRLIYLYGYFTNLHITTFRGPELVANGGFDDGSAWLKEGGWTISSGKANFAGDPYYYIEQDIGAVAGKTYEVSLTISGLASPIGTGDGIKIGLASDLKSLQTNGRHTFQIMADTTGSRNLGVWLDYTSGGTVPTFSIDNVSVKEVYDVSVSEPAKVNVYFKQDNEKDWQYAGTMDTSGDPDIFIGELAVDYRARTFQVKIESETPFEFLGMEFDYLNSGMR